MKAGGSRESANDRACNVRVWGKSGVWRRLASWSLEEQRCASRREMMYSATSGTTFRGTNGVRAGGSPGADFNVFQEAGNVIIEDDDCGEWSGSNRQASKRGPAMLDQELVLVLDNS